MTESKIKEVQKDYRHITREQAIQMFVGRKDDEFLAFVAEQAGITSKFPTARIWKGYELLVDSPKLYQIEGR